MIRGTSEGLVQITLPTRIGYERIAMECSASFARFWGTGSERVEDLKTAVAEACLNAMEHGNRGRPEAQVVVTLDRVNGAIVVQVKDEGTGIPEIPPDPDIERKIQELEPARGLGLFLIRHLMDQVELNEITEQGHVVRMVIRAENQQPGSGSGRVPAGETLQRKEQRGNGGRLGNG
jgi:serine/threonine-protein kinase RsbW